MNTNCVSLNLDEAIKRMGDREIFLEIARYFASRLPGALEELLLALNAGNVKDSTRYAHSLKSNCSSVGADELRKQCHSLEEMCRQGDFEDARILYTEIVPSLMSLRDTLLML